jgi:hypothetical protein
MTRYAIIETDEGMTVTELPPGAMAEDTATEHGGVVVDPGPYATFEDAYDAMLALQDPDDEG